MEWNWRKITITLMATVVTVAVLYGGQVLWQNYVLAKPLDGVLKNIEGVSDARWEDGMRKTDKVTVYVTLAKVQNLEKTYTEIYDKSKSIVGARPLTIVIKDNRTPELEEFYYTVQPALQEGIFTGKFTEMVNHIRGLADKQGIAAAVNVDLKYVYVQLTKGDNAMYVLVPRLAAAGGVANGTR